MKLTVPQIIEIIKSPHPGRKSDLELMTKHDKRCRFHADPETEPQLIEYLPDLKSWVQKIIHPDKFAMFEHLLTLPVATVETVSGIMDELKKVFEAQDRYVSYEFTQPELNDRWTDLRKRIGETNWWKTKGFSVMKSAINSFVIVDVIPTQTGLFPEPYFYVIGPDDVIDALPKADSNLEYIVFKFGDLVFAFDDGHFRSFKPGNEEQDPVLIMEVPHSLGYTPGTPFWNTDFDTESKLRKQNPMTGSLSQLDKLLVKMIMGDHLEWYAGFPVMIGIEHKCDYTDAVGNHCVSGTVYMGEGKEVSCPKCAGANKSINGPGTFLKAPARSSNDDPDNMDGFRFVSPETEAINAMSGSVDRAVAWITYNMIGVPDEVTSEAINEKQVVSQFESRINVLNEVAVNFERIQQWTEDTLCRLAYGSAFIRSTVKYGSMFFLHSAEQMKANYEKAKTSGAAIYELLTQRQAIIQAEFKNNPYMKQRAMLLSWLEPYPDMLVADLSGIGVSKEFVILKAGLDNFVSRFEREFTDIVSFMATAPLKTKMDFIGNQLLEYVEEQMPEEVEPDPAKPPIPGQPPVPAV